MIAYNRQWLDNSEMQDQLELAYEYKDISLQERDEALTQFPVGFYTPNIFIRVGLFLLTIVIVLFSYGLFALITIQGSEKAIGGLSIFFGLACYAALEVMVRTKFHFRSGVDDALLLMGAVCIVGGANAFSSLPALINAVMIFVLTAYGAIRFTDRLMTVFAILSFLSAVFYLFEEMGAVGRAVLPFILMLLSALIYIVVSFMNKKHSLRHYAGCFTIASIVSLCCFYISGNYFAVKQASESLLELGPVKNIPFSWLFWLFTVCTPLLYIGCGIVKKDIILIRTGLLLITFTIFTVRYYYSVMPAETAMIIAGILLMMISFMLQRWLKQPRAGFIAVPARRKSKAGLENIEALLIAKTLGHGQEQPATKFGGGGFGGGGASGDF